MYDLRSDTVTRPCPKMLGFMIEAPLGDDVLGDDPTVHKLEKMAARMFGMEKALFCPSGTMTNQIALALHSGPLQEIICEQDSHVFQYEVGGIAYHARSSIKTIQGQRGKLTSTQIEGAINPIDIHKPETSVLSLENTTNRGGGDYYTLDEIKLIHQACKKNNIKLHLDGARLFNALVETNENPKEYGNLFETISICLSKGLGAPVGSLLLCNADHEPRARKLRKVMGGGMRQSGILAGAAIYALENNIDRLKEDHKIAFQFQESLEQLPYVDHVLDVKTNIVIFELRPDVDPEGFLNYLTSNNVHCYGFGGQNIRFVTHKDFDPNHVSKVTDILERFIPK